jgi:hypothetical protein
MAPSSTLHTYKTGLAVSSDSSFSKWLPAVVFKGDQQFACRAALFEVFFYFVSNYLGGALVLLAADTNGAHKFIEAFFDGFEVFQAEFKVDDLLVAHRVDGAVDVHHVVVVETTHHVNDGVYFPDIGQKLVA